MKRQTGAAAVEFALVLPILIVLLLGIMEFGYFLFLNSAAAGAAREGARAAAISGLTADGKTRAESAFSNTTNQTGSAKVTLAPPPAAVAPASCTPGAPVYVTVTSSYGALTGFFGSNFTASGTGEMRCGG